LGRDVVKKGVVAASLIVSLVSMFVLVPVARATAATYRLQLDAKPPAGEPWSFLRFFPGGTLKVHQGDTVDAAWAGVGTPHTATAIPAGNADAWRANNQGPGGPANPATYPWATEVPDVTVGGDDDEIDLNPSVGAPSDPSCGTSLNPCAFDGASVVNSGLLFSDPTNQPQYFVNVTAPAGRYSFVCLLHPGMQTHLQVVPDLTTIPTPEDVAATAKQQVRQARSSDGEIADDLAQTIKRTPDGGHTRVTIWAGGFWNQVSADEFPDRKIRMHVGDRLRVLGNFEIHTATFPARSAATVPFIVTQCEVAGADTPASSPAGCAAPSDFQLVFNTKAIMPTESNALRARHRFVNSGLIVWGQSHNFVAARPGTYTFVCLVHGPQMSDTVVVS
jgi:plastocyanin